MTRLRGASFFFISDTSKSRAALADMLATACGLADSAHQDGWPLMPEARLRALWPGISDRREYDRIVGRH